MGEKNFVHSGDGERAAGLLSLFSRLYHHPDNTCEKAAAGLYPHEIVTLRQQSDQHNCDVFVLLKRKDLMRL
jgi:hypothetical protein